MSIADKLTLLINTKQDIKSAISEKGVEVTGGMTTYADAIRRIETGGGGGSISSIDIPVGLKFAYSTIRELPQLNLDYGYEDGSYMFYNCDDLGRIEGINSKEGSYLTNTSYMFGNCFSLQSVPLLNTSSVTNMDSMFNFCKSLTTIPLLNTSSVTNMANMFSSCESLTTIPLLNTSSVTNMVNMFYYCKSLTTIPQLDTSNVTDISYMFSDCFSLTTIPQLDTSNVTNISYMFGGCRKISTIPLLNTSSVNKMKGLFSGCRSLTTIPQLDTSNVTTVYDLFAGCVKLESLPLLDFSNVTDTSYMFSSNPTSYPQPYPNLTDLGGFKNLKVSLYGLDGMPNLTVQSLMNVINNLYDFVGNGESTTRTLQLGTTNLNKLTAEQKAVATNKGWVLE